MEREKTGITAGEWYRKIEKLLKEAGGDSPAFDALCLLEDIGGVGRGGLPAAEKQTLSAQQGERLREAADQRAAGRPLQYILGQWDFLTLTLSVGEGVLIPRPDTECLCLAAADRLKGSQSPRVLDLCAGSGCVGLGVASLVPGVQVTAVELSEKALGYLQENIARYPDWQVEAVQADILHDAGRFPDKVQAILSNPPYIPRRDMPSLQREVQWEPAMALDGGQGDGLLFYRAIASDWLDKLLPGGFCAVEVGIGQAASVAALWKEHGLQDIRIFRDLGGIERVVMGTAARA